MLDQLDISTIIFGTPSSCRHLQAVVADENETRFKVSKVKCKIITSKLFLLKALFVSHESFSDNTYLEKYIYSLIGRT